jgi:3-oxoacyl-[acyl-carrier-protein] synthase II
VNATLAGGQVSSLFALRHARVAITQGRAARLLVGGAEELTPSVAWAWYRADALAPDAPIGEGCAMFLVEDPADAATHGRTPRAEVLGCEVGFVHDAPSHRYSLVGGLASCVERALERSGVTADEIDVVAVGATHHIGLQRIEERALDRVLGRVPRQVRVADTLGECFSAGGALQLAALLALWDEGSSDRFALVTSIGHDGNVGCAVIRNAQVAG